MATPSEPATAGIGDGDRRLHPLSWLFVLLQQLRAFAVPLLLLLVTGRGNSADLLGLVGVGGLVVMSILQFLTYRYRPGEDGILIRRGVFQRTTRDIPYERIHNTALHQSLLHRIVGVAELRLESAGSKEAEATMRVLRLADARALETLVRERSLARRIEPAEANAAPLPVEAPLLALGTWELVRLGLISNRGLIVVAAAFGASWQLMGEGRILPQGWPDAARSLARAIGARFAVYLHDAVALVAAGVVIVLAFVVIVRLLSVALAILQFHGFSLVEIGLQLRVERGLLTRVRSQVPRRRIQAWRISETLLHRWFGRQSLRVDSAVAASGNDEQGIRHLAPVVTPAALHELMAHLLPGVAWPPATWRSLHPRAWRRLFLTPLVVLVGATCGIVWQFGAAGLLLLLIAPLLVVRARRLARCSGFAVTETAVAVRNGWLSRRWGIVEVHKLQSLSLTQSPIDRHHGMATLWLDTAGAGAAEGVVRIRFLPAGEARGLFDLLSAAIGREAGTAATGFNAGAEPAPLPVVPG